MSKKLAFDPTKVSVQDELQYEAVKAKGPAAVMQFIEMLEKGETVRMAAMLATQSPPTTGISDQIYQRNKRSLIDQFNGSEIVMNQWKAEYKRSTGEDLPDDAVIFRGLANRPGDPEAVLTHKHSLQDIQNAMRRRNIKVEGEDWSLDPVSAPPKVQDIVIGEDLIAKYAQEAIDENPELLHTMSKQELREMVIDRHGRKVDQSNLTPHGCEDFKSLCNKVFNKETGKAIARKKRKTKQAT